MWGGPRELGNRAIRTEKRGERRQKDREERRKRGREVSQEHM